MLLNMQYLICLFSFQEKDRIRVTSTRDNTLTLSIDPLQPEDTANYTCMGTNQVGYGGKNGTIMVECKF